MEIFVFFTRAPKEGNLTATIDLDERGNFIGICEFNLHNIQLNPN